MKKVGLILSAAAFAVGLSAQAAQPQIDHVKIENLKAEISSNLKNSIANGMLEVSAPSNMTRSWVDETLGYEYTATVTPREGDIRDVIVNGDKLSFEEVPLYLADLVIVTRDLEGNPLAVTDMVMSWPSYSFWTEAENGYFVDAPAGKNQYDIVTLEEMCNTPERTHKFASNLENWIYGEMVHVSPEGGAADPNRFYGIKTYSIATGMGYLISGNQQISMEISDSMVSNIDFKSYTGGFAPVCAFNSDQNLTYTDNGVQRGYTLSVKYVGTGNYMGWVREDYELEIKNPPHVFYMGVAEDEEDKGGPVFDKSYELNKYYLFFPVGNIAVNTEAAAGGAFNPDARQGQKGYVGFGFTKEAQDKNEMDGSHWIWFKGPFYLDKGTENPFAYLNLRMPDYEYDKVYGWVPVNYCPVNCSIIPYGISNCYWGDWGMMLCYQENIVTLRRPTSMGIGTPEGIYVDGVDNFGNTWKTNKYNGKFVFHYNENNIDEIQELDAIQPNPLDGVSPIESIVKEGVAIVAADGVINVASTQDAVAYVYDFSGALVASQAVVGGKNVNINVNNGMYIVKVGKTVKKVVL